MNGALFRLNGTLKALNETEIRASGTSGFAKKRNTLLKLVKFFHFLNAAFT